MTEIVDLPPGKIALEAAGVVLGEHYEELIDMLADHMVKPGGVAIDGGANGGRHTIPLARRVRPDGIVHAFEPQADVVEANRGWARHDGVEDVIRYHVVGLFDIDGDAEFIRNTTSPAFSSLRFTPVGMETEKVVVPLRRLDDLLPDVRVDFIKMDVEGAEYSAFRGAEALIARGKPFIVFENALEWAGTCFGYTRDDFFALFARLKLELFDAFGRRFTAAQWDNPDVGWYFCAFPASRVEPAIFQEWVQAFWRDRLAAVTPPA